MTRRTGCFAILLVPIVFVAVVLMLPSRARRSLPWNATEIQEHYSDARFGSDFTRCLKAKINENEFNGYADRLDLTETFHRGDTRHSRIHWPNCSERWWTPPKSLDGAKIQLLPDPNYFAVAKYHDGYVYFGVFSW